MNTKTNSTETVMICENCDFWYRGDTGVNPLCCIDYKAIPRKGDMPMCSVISTGSVPIVMMEVPNVEEEEF